MKIGIVILAAGNGSRFGENKLLKEVFGQPMIQRVMSAVPKDWKQSTVVVTQYDAVEQLAAQRGIGCVRNEMPELGISRSVALGTQALSDCDGILYLVGDQPLITEPDLRRLIDAWERNPCFIVAAAHNGKRGNPCLFPKEFFPELRTLTGDRGGSAILKRRPDRVRPVELPEKALWDCDTAEEYEKLNTMGGDRIC